MSTPAADTLAIESQAGRPVIAASTPDDLQRIHDPGVQLVHWARAIAPGQAGWLEALPPERLPNVRVKVPLGAVEAAMEAAFEARGVLASPGRHMLVADILLLAMLYSHVEQSDWLAIRLEAIDHDACRRPHVDQVSTRLLCTYRGAGTEFGRVAAGGWKPELSLAPFEVGLVKGLLHPTLRNPAGCSLAHRSPRFPAGDPARLLICIDRADAPSTATYH